jgi:DNA-directed RNA polymerase beta subunit
LKAVNGDKFTTLHGQKGVVTILNDNEMSVVNGRSAEIVISSSAVFKRETASQILEAACGMFCEDQLLDTCTYSYDEVLDKYSEEHRSQPRKNAHSNIAKRYEGNLYMNNDLGVFKPVMRKVLTMASNIHRTVNVKVNYGVIRVMQSIFMASSKVSYTSSNSRSREFTVSNTSSHGSSKSLGEMDLCQLEASGFRATLQELSRRSDLCVVDVCCTCKCIKILCACTDDNIIYYCY